MLSSEDQICDTDMKIKFVMVTVGRMHQVFEVTTITAAITEAAKVTSHPAINILAKNNDVN